MQPPEVQRPFTIAERVARGILPDLNNRPLYIIAPHDHSMCPSYKGAGGGLFSRGLDLILQPQLEAEGRWRGPGVAIIVDGLHAMRTSRSEADAVSRITGIVLHELGHFLDRPDIVDAASLPTHEKWLELPTNTSPSCPTYGGFTVSFLAHGESFCRLMSHMWFRARSGGGLVLGLKSLGFGSDYPSLEYLPSPAECVETLWQELESRRTEPLREIVATEPPCAYLSLWSEVYTRFPTLAEAT